MTDTIFILNGPNLNLLGNREPRIYGSQTLSDITEMLQRRAKALKLTLDVRQSNHEGVLVDWLHEAMAKASAVIINGGGYAHTSLDRDPRRSGGAVDTRDRGSSDQRLRSRALPPA
jgi:3-dehydroquinate dehydratase-2